MQRTLKIIGLLLVLGVSVMAGNAIAESERSATQSVTYIVGGASGSPDQQLTSVATRVTGYDVSCDATCTGYLSDGTSVTNTKRVAVTLGAAGSRFVPIGDVACGDGGCFRKGIRFAKLYWDHQTAATMRVTVITEPY